MILYRPGRRTAGHERVHEHQIDRFWRGMSIKYVHQETDEMIKLYLPLYIFYEIYTILMDGLVMQYMRQ